MRWRAPHVPGSVYRCVGTTSKFYLITGEEPIDITPERTSTSSTATITTTASSSVILITEASPHGATVGDYVVFSGFSPTTAVDGIPTSTFTTGITNDTDGYQIHEVVSDTEFKVDVVTTATAGGLQAHTFDISYKVSSGTSANTSGSGFGVGGYGGDDTTPTEYAMDDVNGNVRTLAFSKLLTLNVFTGPTLVPTTDWIYPTGLAGTIDGVPLEYYNDKWWQVNSVDPVSGGYRILGDYTASSPGTGGGVLGEATVTGGICYIYDGSAGTVLGATRGWDEGTTASVAVTTLRDVSVDNFGEDLIFANRGGPLYYYDVSAKTSSGVPTEYELAVEINSTNFSGSTQPPEIVDGFVISEGHGHCVAWGCNDIGASTQNKMLIRWSERHNPFEWEPTPSSEAGGDVLRHGSEILSVISTKDEFLIFTDTSLYSMRYVGYPEIYGISLVSQNVTTFSRGSAIAVDNSVYFMANGHFYMYNGSVQPLGKEVSNYVFDNINKDQSGKVFAAVNSMFTEVLWFYPDSNSFEPNRYVSYNYSNHTWGMGLMDMTPIEHDHAIDTDETSNSYNPGFNRTCWEDVGVVDNPTAGYIIAHDPSAVPAVDRAALMSHEVGTSAQSGNIEHYVESAEVDLDGEGGAYAFYDKIIPDIERFNLDEDLSTGIMTVSMKGRNLPGKTTRDETSITVDYSNQDDSTLNYAPDFNDTTVRGRARSVSLKVLSNTSGFGWRLGEVRVRMRPDGRD
jgi:hypothetical protein